MITPLRNALAPALLVGVLAAGVAVPARGAPQVSTAAASARIHVMVDGSAVGYTHRDLTRLVASCLADLPLPDEAAPDTWELQMHFDGSSSFPHPVEAIRATLFNQGRLVASRSTRTLSPDVEPRAEFCDSVASLTQQLLATVAAHAPKLASKASNPSVQPS